jgi:hypothetical protein
MKFSELIDDIKTKIDFSIDMSSNIKTGLFIGTTVSSLIGFLFRLFGSSLILIMIILYLYPITGLIVGYFNFKNRKEPEFVLERGYHG